MSAEPNQGLLDASIEIAARRKDTLVALKKTIRAQVSWDEADRFITKLVPDEATNSRKNRPSLALVKGK